MNQDDIQALLQLIKDDMKLALGVTEPGAIAFVAAKAKSYVHGPVEHVCVAMNSGMYKNAFTCGIPNSHQVGNIFAAALGIVAGNAEKGLEALADVTAEDNKKAQKLIDEGKVSVKVQGITSRIFLEAEVRTASEVCTVTVLDKHTNVVRITLNGDILFENEDPSSQSEADTDTALIHRYTLAQLYEFASIVDKEAIQFIQQAYMVNYDLFRTGLVSPRTTFAKELYRINGHMVISDDELKTAQLLCNATIEARVIGLDKPAMSITGSGAHGIICTMPLYAVCQVDRLSQERLLRATVLSYLVTMYIKEYSGRLSAFCGCAIAAGIGMACALVYMKRGTLREMEYAINNMASSITGMICDGGNQGCTMKGVVAVDAAFHSVQFAMNGICVDSVHGINGKTPEETFRNIGKIASPGMTATEKTIVDIFEGKIK